MSSASSNNNCSSNSCTDNDEELNEQLRTLLSLIPGVAQTDSISILEQTRDYLGRIHEETERLEKEMPSQPQHLENLNQRSMANSSSQRRLQILRVCFSYYSMFPLDQKIDRDLLIRLWMAEGFIQLSDETNEMSMEDIGKRYLNNLLDEFYIEKKDESGYIKCFRLDSFTHQLARQVANSNTILSATTKLTYIIGLRRLRLVFDEDGKSTDFPNGLLYALSWRLRTLVGIQGIESKKIKQIFSNYGRWRVLELRNCWIGKLTDLLTIKYIRYLDLSYCQDVLFGQPISDCWYLQTLVLRGCSSLGELPQGIGSLINLRYLDVSHTRIADLDDVGTLENLVYIDVSETNIKELPKCIKNLCKLKTFKFDGCRYLEVLPSEFATLTHLKGLDLTGTRIKELHQSIITCLYNLKTLKLVQCKLPEHIGVFKRLKHLVYEGNETPRGIRQLTRLRTLQQYVVSQSDGGLADLEDLNLLQEIKICNLENVKYLVHDNRGNLKGKQHIRCLDLHWTSRSFHSGYQCNDGEVLGALEPHPNLEILKMKNFMGSVLPGWIGDSLSYCLPKLVELSMAECSQLKQLPALGQLPNLKILFLRGMDSVQRLGNELYRGEASSSKSAPTSAFPCLVELKLEYMGNLESWDAPATLPHFPLLEKLTISFCSKLKVIRTPFPSTNIFGKVETEKIGGTREFVVKILWKRLGPGAAAEVQRAIEFCDLNVKRSSIDVSSFRNPDEMQTTAFVKVKKEKNMTEKELCDLILSKFPS